MSTTLWEGEAKGGLSPLNWRSNEKYGDQELLLIQRENGSGAPRKRSR